MDDFEDTLATQKQKAKFFALCRELGYDSTEAKERAKARYNLESFSEISKNDLSYLIELLVDKIEINSFS